MDFELSSEHKLFRDTVRDFADKEVAPGALERDKTHEFPHDLIEEDGGARPHGSALFPEEYGGAGATPSHTQSRLKKFRGRTARSA